MNVAVVKTGPGVIWPTAILGLGAATLLLRFKLNATWLMLGGGAIGLALHLLGYGR